MNRCSNPDLRESGCRECLDHKDCDIYHVESLEREAENIGDSYREGDITWSQARHFARRLA